jgi:hypothetical protein
MCGFAQQPPAAYEHVIWIWFENRDQTAIIGSSETPYTHGVVGARCGLATNFHNETHPSLPNYIAATSGSTQGLARNCGPQACAVSARSFFRQLELAGKSWKGYAESMPRNCAPFDKGKYAARHNPPPYYKDIAKTCAANNTRLGTPTSGPLATDLAGGTLPSFATISPDLCNDTHDCNVRTGDRWLKGWLNAIVNSKVYLAGKTAVFVTWDEGRGGEHGQDCTTSSAPDCHIATYVLGPAVRPGTRVDTNFNHYSMLRTTSEMLGLKTFLGRAATAVSMRAPFRL